MSWLLWVAIVLAVFVVALAMFEMRERRNETETQRRAREHNRNRGGMPKMCGECGGYMILNTSYSMDDYWSCDICAEERQHARERRRAEVAAHNARVRAARQEANEATQ